MARIRLTLDRQESYCLLAAQEYLRQLMSGADYLLGDSPDDEGIPLIRSISPSENNREYTGVRFVLEFRGDSFGLEVEVAAGDLWPKKGTAYLQLSGEMEYEGTAPIRHEFELRGNPGYPRVVFTAMRGGG